MTAAAKKSEPATVTFQKEYFLKIMPELPPLFMAEWEEVSQGKENRQTLKPVWATYLQMEITNLLHVLTARAEGKLVGYVLNVVHPHLHFGDVLYAFVDAFYLRPEYRRDEIDVQMVMENEKLIRDLGAKRINFAVNPSLWLYRLMKELQYARTECILSKWL